MANDIPIITLMFIGIIITIVGYYRDKERPKEKVIYKFIDQTVDEAYTAGRTDNAYNTYLSMFTDAPLFI